MPLAQRPLSLLSLFLLAFLLPACATQAPPSAPPNSALTSNATTIGHSRQNRPIRAMNFGRGSTRIYLIGSIHGDEPESRYPIQHIISALNTSTHDATIRLVLDMNPDGSHAHSRANAAGVDLNRNWPATNFTPAQSRGNAPLSEPESTAVYRDIQVFNPHLIIVLHSARSGPFMNYDGPAVAKSLSEAFVLAAQKAGDPRWRTVPDMGYPTPGSLGSYFGHNRQLPILTVELRRGDQPHQIIAPLLAGLNAVFSSHAARSLPTSPSPLQANRQPAP